MTGSEVLYPDVGADVGADVGVEAWGEVWTAVDGGGITGSEVLYPDVGGDVSAGPLSSGGGLCATISSWSCFSANAGEAMVELVTR